MLLTPHTLVGVVIGASLPNISYAVPLAFLSHYAGDMLPHWDPFDSFSSADNPWKGWKAVLVQFDLILGVALGTLFTLHALWINQDAYLALNIFLCGIAAVMPDVLYIPKAFLDSKNWLIRLNYTIQASVHNKADILWGNVTQVTVAVSAFCTAVSLLTQ